MMALAAGRADLSTGVELFLKEDGMVEKETDSDTFYNAMETLS